MVARHESNGESQGAAIKGIRARQKRARAVANPERRIILYGERRNSDKCERHPRASVSLYGLRQDGNARKWGGRDQFWRVRTAM
jgi:hypothetical protein